ncbi:MAG: phosphoglycerate kinase, partial [bacterium]|nr:phosphoglycerate kinase [bacterium]
NLRFYLGEMDNDSLFSKVLASYGDVYVNDAFGSCHRKHSSVYGVVEHLRPAVAGYLVAKEVEYFSKLVHDPPRPFVMVIGGFKLSTKLDIIENTLDIADKIIIGGGMAYTFLKAQGGEVGISPVENSYIKVAAKLLETAADKLVFPIDRVCAPRYNVADGAVTTDDANVPEGLEGVDIGPKTMELFSEVIASAGSIFWNGPMGVFETPGFDKGTEAIAMAIAKNEGFTVIGGGDSVYAIKKFGFGDDDFSHIGTGGGASLNFMANSTLPAIEVLDKK